MAYSFCSDVRVSPRSALASWSELRSRPEFSSSVRPGAPLGTSGHTRRVFPVFMMLAGSTGYRFYSLGLQPSQHHALARAPPRPTPRPTPTMRTPPLHPPPRLLAAVPALQDHRPHRRHDAAAEHGQACPTWRRCTRARRHADRSCDHPSPSPSLLWMALFPQTRGLA